MVEASLAKGSSDLRFLVTHHKVTADVQAKLYDNSIDTVAKFAAFVSDAADLRDVLKTDLGIDPASSLSLRAQAASLSGSLIPPWPLILSYEHAIRKHAYKLMATDGRSFGDALAKAYKEATVKERHFTTPLALHAKRPNPSVLPPPLNPYQRDPKKGKGKLGKGKDKQPTKFGTLAGTSNRTPDGKPICYRFNAKEGCKKGDKSHFAHVCLHCFAKHPATQCPTLKSKKDDKQQAAN